VQEPLSTRPRVSGASCYCRTLPVAGIETLAGRKVDLLAVHDLFPERYPHFLESAATGTPQARYNILFAFPGETLRLEADGRIKGPLSEGEDNDFLDAFDRWWCSQELSTSDKGENLPPFTGGWFVYLGYELAGQIEPSLNLPVAPGDMPVAFATRFPAAIIFDHEAGEIILMTESESESLLDDMEADLRRACKGAATLAPVSVEDSCLVGELIEDTPERHLDGARQCIDYVFAGDVFQVNLSRLWKGTLRPDISHGELYDRLRRRNPAPFAGMATLDGMAIISSSPERLIEVRGSLIQTRPIAGTRPRGASGITDVALSSELIGHPKERAEHIMLVDLERNDISRVCIPGSVHVNEMMVVESYAHVHHIVSNVRGELASAITPGEVVRAVFPGGTITGCPKVRCMEILAELEAEGRGPYTGAMGYVNRDGSLDLNILIRTMLRQGNEVRFRAGGGIVADSDPQKELEETRAKARGLIRALTQGGTRGEE
jgi:anthranilate synthase component I